MYYLVAKKISAYSLEISGPDANNQILLLFDLPYGSLLAQVGTFLTGVAVAS